MNSKYPAVEEAAAYSAALDGLAALRELLDAHLLTESLYEAHANAVLAHLDPRLQVWEHYERSPLSADLVNRRIVARRVAAAPRLAMPPSGHPQDALPVQLVAEAARLLVAQRSGSAVLLCEHFTLAPQMVVRLLWRLVEVGVLHPAAVGRRRWPKFRPVEADAVYARVITLCATESATDPASAETADGETQDIGLRDQLQNAATLVITTQFGSASMLQRKLGVDFATACRLMNSLEASGVVGLRNDSGPRTVLVPAEALDAVLTGLAGDG